ncbi:MAG: hypothetical protein Q8R71_10845 [Phenylobacterium sp.]|nr:hypothetical protein [Phenylobacterium sp.]
MTHAPGARLARLLAAMAIALQVLLPGSVALAGTAGGDVSPLICAPSGQVSAEARAAAERLAHLTGDERPGEAPSDDHCALCTVPYAAAPGDRTLFAAPCRFAVEVEHVSNQPGLIRRTQGPPLGSRAPPPRT